MYLCSFPSLPINKYVNVFLSHLFLYGCGYNVAIQNILCVVSVQQSCWSFCYDKQKANRNKKKQNEEMKKRNSEAEGKGRALENDNIYETSTHEDIIQPFKWSRLMWEPELKWSMGFQWQCKNHIIVHCIR